MEGGPIPTGIQHKSLGIPKWNLESWKGILTYLLYFQLFPYISCKLSHVLSCNQFSLVSTVHMSGLVCTGNSTTLTYISSLTSVPISSEASRVHKSVNICVASYVKFEI